MQVVIPRQECEAQAVRAYFAATQRPALHQYVCREARPQDRHDRHDGWSVPSTNGDPATDRLPIHIQNAYAGILRGNDLPRHFADAL